MHDTTLDKSLATVSRGNEDAIEVAGDSGGLLVRRGLLRFNIPPFISAGQITQAVLHIYGKEGSTVSISMHPVTASWYERDFANPAGTGFLSYGATWNCRGGDDNATAWAAAGGDYDQAAGTAVTIGNGWNAVDVTGFVSSNFENLRLFGVLLKLADEAGTAGQELGSREAGEAQAPYLELTVDLGLPENTYLYPLAADIYIDEEEPDHNFNWKTRVLISWHPAKGTARGLWKFDVPAGIDASRIDSAILFLSGSEHAMNYNELEVACHALNQPFDEGLDTWNSLAGGDYTSDNATGTLCQEILPGAPVNWRAQIDVTSLLAGNLDKIRDNGLLIRSAGEGSMKLHQNMAAREAYDITDRAAYLEIKVTPTTVLTSTTTSASSSGGGGGGGGGGGATTSSSSTSSIATTTSTSIPADDLSTTTTAVEPPPETTTTTTAEPQQCVIEQLLPGSPDQIAVFRKLRDERMAQSGSGLLLTALYYVYNKEASAILKSNAGLRTAAQGCLRDLLPAVAAGLQSGDEIVMSPKELAGLVGLLQNLQAHGSGGLRLAIGYALQQMADGEMLNVMKIDVENDQ